MINQIEKIVKITEETDVYIRDNLAPLLKKKIPKYDQLIERAAAKGKDFVYIYTPIELIFAGHEVKKRFVRMLGDHYSFQGFDVCVQDYSCSPKNIMVSWP